MPSRKRRTTKKATAQAEAAVPEEREEPVRASVTQVVEVVEVADEGESASEPEIQSSGTTEEIPEASEETVEPVEEKEPERTERKKEMVDELYSEDRGPSVMPEISMHKRNRTKPIVVWAMITIVVALVSGGILFAVTKPAALTSMLAGPTPTPEATPTPVATPTPEEIDKTALSIQVLNGGGTPGAAGKMKSLLTEKGYTVSNTGNTDEYTFDTTEIHVKASASAALAHLEADLKEDYVLGTTAADLADESDYDAQVIVGKE